MRPNKRARKSPDVCEACDDVDDDTRDDEMAEPEEGDPKKRKRKRKRQLRLFFLNFFAFRHLTLNKSICPNAPKSYIAIECRTPNI